MKLLSVIILSLFFYAANAQGKYAGSYKQLIGKIFADEKKIPGLKGFSYHEGTMLSSTDEAAPFFSELYRKGSTYIFLLTRKTFSSAETYKILDVLEIRNVQAPWEVKSSTCRQNEKEDDMVVALVKAVNTAYLKNIKQAWRIDLAKGVINATSTKGIDCINEGFGE